MTTACPVVVMSCVELGCACSYILEHKSSVGASSPARPPQFVVVHRGVVSLKLCECTTIAFSSRGCALACQCAYQPVCGTTSITRPIVLSPVIFMGHVIKLKGKCVILYPKKRERERVRKRDTKICLFFYERLKFTIIKMVTFDLITSLFNKALIDNWSWKIFL